MSQLATFKPDAWAQGKVALFPLHLQRAITREWERRRNRPLRALHVRVGVLDDGREAEANNWLRELVNLFPTKALELGASEDRLVEYAKARAEEGEKLRIEGADILTLQAYCQAHGLDLPNGEDEESRAKRVGCSLWWRRNLRKVNGRKIEALSISLGLVHNRHCLYASHDAVYRRRDQRRRNRALLDALTAINELGQEYTLSELADLSTSNPAIKRAELMVRIAGFEYIAQALGMAGEFITITAPSRYHAFKMVTLDEQYTSVRNKKFDPSITPTTTRDYLGKVWSRINASLARQSIPIFGIRVAEPHHDGTPHFHGLFFMRADHVPAFRQTVARYACREDRHELKLDYVLTQKDAITLARQQIAAGAKGALCLLASRIHTEADFWQCPPSHVWGKVEKRVCFKAIDWNIGTAAGYIAKYIAKNIDGKRVDGSTVGEDFEAQASNHATPDDGHTTDQDKTTDSLVTARRVDAWAATWGIRQFQQVGGPPVGVWRELRRWDYAGSEDDLMRAAAAADAGHWGRFVEVMGGIERKRRDMPLQLARDTVPATNRYGETGQRRLVGVVETASGQLAISRMHEWRITRGEKMLGSDSDPWTRVYNSTEIIKPAPMPASQGEIDRIIREAEDMERGLLIRPLDTQFMTAEQSQAARTTRLAKEHAFNQLQQQRQDMGISAFMAQVQRIVAEAEHTALTYREATLIRVKGRELLRRFTRLPADRGIQIFSHVPLPPAVQHRPDHRWKANGPGKTIEEQGEDAIRNARHLYNTLNPDPYGVLSMRR